MVLENVGISKSLYFDAKVCPSYFNIKKESNSPLYKNVIH